MDILISNLLSETILDFRKWSNGKHMYTHTCVFSVWPLPKVENWFRKQIWKDNTHNSIQKKNLKSFGHYLIKSKNRFPIVFSKCDLTGVGSNFGQKKNYEKAKHPQNMPKFGWRGIISLPFSHRVKILQKSSLELSMAQICLRCGRFESRN